jgi:hypothetical protein
MRLKKPNSSLFLPLSPELSPQNRGGRMGEDAHLQAPVSANS